MPTLLSVRRPPTATSTFFVPRSSIQAATFGMHRQLMLRHIARFFRLAGERAIPAARRKDSLASGLDRPIHGTRRSPKWVKLRRTQCEHMSSGLLPNSDIARRPRHFAFVPISDIAIYYSITLSARADKASGTVTPIALAVLRLITSSNFVGCSIGRSAGALPRKRPAANRAYRSAK
jgi:hypothetical protein